VGELVVGEAGFFGAEEQGDASFGGGAWGIVVYPRLRIERWGTRFGGSVESG
jgi:hypothetical protein